MNTDICFLKVIICHPAQNCKTNVWYHIYDCECDNKYKFPIVSGTHWEKTSDGSFINLSYYEER